MSESNLDIKINAEMRPAPATVRHEAEFWLTMDPTGPTLFAGGSPPKKDGGMWVATAPDGDWVKRPDDEHVIALADPTKPVRIRLELQAERIDA